jgi:hypothetical protein
MRHLSSTLLLTAVLVSPALAQARRAQAAPSAAQVQRAVQTITEAGYRARIGALADDSMRGRLTPSPELDKAAAYIASEFRRFGLRPGGDSGTYLQRYAIRRLQLDTATSTVAIGTAVLRLGRDATVAFGTMPAEPVSGPVVLVWGAPADTAHPLGDVPVRGAVVLQVSSTASTFGGPTRLLSRAAFDAGAKAWIVIPAIGPSAFDGMARTATAVRLEVDGGGPTQPLFLVARDSAVAGILSAAGTGLAELRASGAAGVRALAGTTATIRLRRNVLSEQTAPNVIGILEGSDPALKNEYVFFTAHMDHVGVAGQPTSMCTAQGADSICNGADDDASGTTGVIELAQAFASLNPRPRRSLVFMTVSGEERGLWGSGYYASHPEVPLASTVADLNMDMIGRNWRDTISVIGKEHSSLGETANRITREHPELNMRLVGDLWPSENFYRRSDHFNFARKGVPILFFFNGTHPQYHRPSDEVPLIDAEKAARIVRMVFYIGLDVATTTERPQWNPESRRQIVEATP